MFLFSFVVQFAFFTFITANLGFVIEIGFTPARLSLAPADIFAYADDADDDSRLSSGGIVPAGFILEAEDEVATRDPLIEAAESPRRSTPNKSSRSGLSPFRTSLARTSAS